MGGQGTMRNIQQSFCTIVTRRVPLDLIGYHSLRFWILFFCLVLTSGCVSHSPKISLAVEHRFSPMDASTAEDPAVAKLLQPYAEKVASLEIPIGFAEEELRKDQPEGKLGNFVADLLLEESRRLFGQTADVSFANNGGLRVPIARGEISRRTIYELMPFENQVVMIELSGAELRQLAEQIANSGGQPVAGMTLEITSERKLSDVRVRGESLGPEKKYRVVTSDYLAQGNGGFFNESKIDRAKNSGALVRDVIIDHIRARSTVPVSGKLDGRIRILN
jgi:2',3'-cyclic-nucleotide 2'-phosphodiesterase (5'-nucleotidase family)